MKDTKQFFYNFCPEVDADDICALCGRHQEMMP